MGLSWITITLLGLFALGVRWFLKLPVPPGFKNPWKLRLMFAVLDLFNFGFWVMTFFKDELDIMLKLRNAKPMSRRPDLPTECQDTDIVGVKVRIYRPMELPANNNPGIIFYHGGGWMCGNLETYNAVNILMAHKLKCVVVSVEYRLAPENPYPAPLNDCVAVARYILENPQEYGIDGSRIALSGESAGSNLAAATALKLRDLKVKPQPKLQVLFYPCLQAIDFNSPSYQLCQDHVLLSRKKMVYFWSLYAMGNLQHVESMLRNQHTSANIKEEFYRSKLNHDIILKDYEHDEYVPNELGFGDAGLWDKLKDVIMDPYFAPLMAEDLSNLPEALVFTMQHDVLRDDGIWYAEQLKSAGTPVTHHHCMSGFHGMVPMILNLEDPLEARKIAFNWIEARL